MVKGCRNFFKRKIIHDFDALFNAESIDSFVFSISYTKKNTKKWFYKKPHIYLNVIYFLVNCIPISYFLDGEKISKKFIVPTATVRKIREVVSLYRVASLSAYKYLRRIIVLFFVSHCIKVYNI